MLLPVLLPSLHLLLHLLPTEDLPLQLLQAGLLHRFRFGQ